MSVSLKRLKSKQPHTKTHQSLFRKIIANSEEATAQHYSSLDLLRHKHMRRITFIMIYCWFVTSMIYYGLGLNAGSLSGDIFTNNAMYGVFDIFSKVSVSPIAKRI